MWYLISTICIYPHYLSYFNEFVGGPGNAYHYFVESNIDWGQDLFYLRDYLHQNNIENIKLSYWGFPTTLQAPLPDYYDISYQELECGPAEGPIAISVTNLMKHQDCHGWLLEKTPADRVGYSILIY